ncbi:hypothetical protein J5X98_04255 [Leptothermofonsia sichuanensis E412]|uniref:hypothetical protein n=1 Tax=Leptothermofonsia sichuanensis TaxID=2917832 RepID=UPI001CA6BD0A|nr:hypothetical protein [Leptothermofonsia sichuanensis]QZZ21676.1 hypothetical protein J5X98_04255 [Leptothermofonsia sichuanensis E412]
MANLLPLKARKLPSTVAFLWRPMLLIALGCHALLLFVPLGEQKKAPPKADEKAVKITRIPKTKTNLNQPPKPAVRTRPAVQQRRTTPPPPVIVTKPSPTPSPATSPNPKGSPAAKSDQPGGAEGPKVDEVTEAFTEPFAEFVVNRTQVDGSVLPEPLRAPADAPVTAELFPDPNAFFSDPAKLTKRKGLVAFDWFSPIKPDILYYEHIEPIYKGKGYTLTRKGEYGGGDLYEVKKGSNVRYFNIVPTGDKTGTLIMVWKDSPV